MDPPNTVKSCEATNTLRPSIVPYPVTMPSPAVGACPSRSRATDGRERVRLHERPLIHEDVEPLAGGELATVVLLGRGVTSSRLERGAPAPPQFLDPVLDGALGGVADVAAGGFWSSPCGAV